MNWKDLAGKVSDMAPAIGSVLAGPAGGAAGTLLASVFGTEDSPDAVSRAIAADPEAAAKIRQAEMDHALEMRQLMLSSRTAAMQEQTKRLASVNDTIRAELSTDNAFKSGWRPMAGWVLTFILGGLGAVLIYAIATDPGLVANESFTGLLIWLVVTLGAIQGVNIKKRSDDKTTRLTGAPPAGLLSMFQRGKS